MMRYRQQGFTLLEMLAAMAVFALMSVMAYGGLASINNSRQAVDRSLTRLAEFQKGWFRLKLDLEQVRSRSIRDQYGDSQPPFRFDDNELVEFTRGGRSNPLGRSRSTLQRVGYQHVEDELVRYHWRVLDRAQDSEPIETTILTGVRTLVWRFLDAGNEWHEQWPPLRLNVDSGIPIPRAVEMVVDTRDWGEMRFVFITTATD